MARQSEPGPPGALQNVSATADDGGVVLRWSAPVDDGGSAIRRYEVRSAEGASVPEFTPWIWTGTFTSFAFRQLTNGTLYSFEVRAVNAQGTGPAAEIQATPGQPSAPQSLTATSEDGAVVLRWSAPADEGSSRILHYQMRSAEGASVPAGTPWSWAGTTTVGVFRQLTNGTLYSFEVRAVNAQGDGPAAQIQATPGFPPSAPRNLTAAASHGQVTLKWEAPADRGSTAITDYEYRYAEGATMPSETAWRSNGRHPFRIVSNLTNGTAHRGNRPRVPWRMKGRRTPDAWQAASRSQPDCGGHGPSSPTPLLVSPGTSAGSRARGRLLPPPIAERP